MKNYLLYAPFCKAHFLRLRVVGFFAVRAFHGQRIPQNKGLIMEKKLRTQKFPKKAAVPLTFRHDSASALSAEDFRYKTLRISVAFPAEVGYNPVIRV